MDESTDKRPALQKRKKLSDLLVESGIVKQEELPRGLEYDQRASDSDLIAVAKAKELITEQGLNIPTALRALTLSKQKRVDLEQALSEIGWRARNIAISDAKQVKSDFNADDLSTLGHAIPSGGLKAGLKASGFNLKPGATKPLALDTANPNDPRFQSSQNIQSIAPRDLSAQNASSEQLPDSFGNESYNYNDMFAKRPRDPVNSEAAHFPEEQLQQPWNDLTETVPNAPNLQMQIQMQMQTQPQPQTPPPPRTDWSTPPSEPQSVPPRQMRQPPPLPFKQPTVSDEERKPLPSEYLLAVQMGDGLFAQHLFEQAEIFYAQALELLEVSGYSNDAQAGDLLVKMGRSCLQMSEFVRSERYLTRAIRIREDLLGRDDIAVAECLDYLAELFDVQSQYLEAERYYLSALGIKERVLSPSASEVANSLKKLVAVSKHRGVSPPEEKLSGELLTEAGILDVNRLAEGLSLAEQRALPVGRALISLNYLTERDLEAVLLAQLLLREGVIPGYLAVRALRLASEQQLEFEDALREIGLEPGDAATDTAFELLETAKQLIRAETKFAYDHPTVAQLCIKLGDLYTGHAQYQQAEALFKRALRIEEKQTPSDSMRLIEVLSRLSDLEFRQLDYEQAEQKYVRLLDLWESQDTDNIAYSNTLESLATLNYVRGDYKEAGRLYQLSINHKERLLGAEHPAVVSALQGRANCFFAVERYPDAEKMYRKAAQVQEKVHGINNEVAINILCILGDLFFAQNEFSKAIEEYAKALDGLGNCADPDIKVFLSVLEKTAHCLYQSGDLEKADTYYRHYINTREGSGTSNQPDMADALERYALVLDGLKRPKEASNARRWAEETRSALATSQ